MKKSQNFNRREEIKGYAVLEELALNFAWLWNQNHKAYKVWEQLDPGLWDLLHNPWVVLQSVSRDVLEKHLSDTNFRKLIDDLVKTNEKEMKSPTWFQQTHSASPLNCIAYFSMEFMLGESLPIYSGGLGNVAGDQLKAASDLGVPVIGIGIFWQQGYFRQVFDKHGAQHALFPYNDPGQLPIMPLRKANGETLRLEVVLPGWSVWLRAWEVKVGRVKLYLLDSNDAVNYPFHRGITSELYGGDLELRLKQELILGMGGYRLLEALGIKADVCHLNEGHAAFAVLERAKNFMKETGNSFSTALAVTRAGNHFTTHTAVPAGFDRFPPHLIVQYLGKYANEQLNISSEELLALGRQNPHDATENFNMTYLAIRSSGSINGVSELHGKVSRSIFASLFPYWPEEGVPVGYVTNGVHMPSWGNVQANQLWCETCGKNPWLGDEVRVATLEKDLRSVPDAKLWEMRNAARKALLEYVRVRLSRIWEARGFPSEEIARAKTLFDPNVLTLGFARRFATYKRPNMLLHDSERLLRILSNQGRPVQLILSGKAHPADKPGQALIQQWIQLFTKDLSRAHVIFLSDYDMRVTASLVRGVDVWINTPRRPWEACGTSGMKVLVNGGINLSELDGWWAEAYTPDVGWALGDRLEHGDDAAVDAAEAMALYDILENQVIPEFYTRNEDGIPTAWIKRIRESMVRLTPQFSADRAVREYTEKHYIPCAANYRARAAENGRVGKKIVDWQENLNKHWPFIRFGNVKIETANEQCIFEVEIYLDGLDPEMIRVELYAVPLNGSLPERHEMSYIRQLPGTPGMYVFTASIPLKRPASDYTPRIIPSFPGLAVPLEATHILWEH